MDQDTQTSQVSPVIQATKCPQCHINVRSTDYYCFNCGKQIKENPLSLSIANIILYIIGSLILPPMGAIWGIRFIKKGNKNTKIYGFLLIILTMIELIVLTTYTVDLLNTVNKQVNSQLQNLQGM